MDKGAIEPVYHKRPHDKTKVDATAAKAYIQNIRQFLS